MMNTQREMDFSLTRVHGPSIGHRTVTNPIGLRTVCLALSLGLIAKAQTPPADQLVYTSGAAVLPSSLKSTPNLLFSSVNGLFDFENLPIPTSPTVYVRKGAGQHGLFIYDNNPADTSVFEHALNVELYNITALLNGNRAGIRVHVDPSNTVPPPSGLSVSNLNGIEIGNHGANTTGLVVETEGAATNETNYATQGVGISSLSWGQYSFFANEGDSAHNTLGTVGAQFNHFSTGNILSLNQGSSVMTGDFIFANAAFNSTGSLRGNFLNFNVSGVPKFRVDASGNLETVASISTVNASGSPQFKVDGSGNVETMGSISTYNVSGVPEFRVDGSGNVESTGSILTTTGTVIIPAIKANSGTRFVCVDTHGTLISQTTPCSGT